ncbi:MAG: TerB family tellurite resistance protein [Gammaproteobacteria bacterium]
MFKKIASFLTENLDLPESTAVDEQHLLKLATATLMIEMARADFDESENELQFVEKTLAQHFDLSDGETSALIEQANQRADHAISLHEFTRLLHEELNDAEKGQIVELLWRVAYADGRLDKYEDHLVRKVADLLYVPHIEFMRLKHKVLSG